MVWIQTLFEFKQVCKNQKKKMFKFMLLALQLQGSQYATAFRVPRSFVLDQGWDRSGSTLGTINA